MELPGSGDVLSDSRLPTASYARNVLSTVRFLQTNGLAVLQERYRIKTRRHLQWPGLVLFKYDQLNSPMGERIVQECRGLILDEANDWAVVSRPFDKFFNYHESRAATLDWNTTTLLEKLDGSLVVLYDYAGQWQVSTSSVPDATGTIHDDSETFADLFWRVWNAAGFSWPRDPDVCYMFELLAPRARPIVRQTAEALILVGARNRVTGLEMSVIDVAADLGWPAPRSWSVASLDEAVRLSRTLDPMKQEGFVAVDAQFNRVKIKSPQYVSIALLGSADPRLDEKYMLEIVRTNESEEFLAYMPQYADLHARVKARYDDLLTEVETFWQALSSVPDSRTFGQRSAACRVQKVLFALRNGLCTTPREGLAAMQVRALLQALSLG